MTRQENITLTQVESKVYEARNRLNKNLMEAAIARTAHDFAKLMQDAKRAENDLKTWENVRTTLDAAA